jgi:hypothetical protein
MGQTEQHNPRLSTPGKLAAEACRSSREDCRRTWGCGRTENPTKKKKEKTVEVGGVLGQKVSTVDQSLFHFDDKQHLKTYE